MEPELREPWIWAPCGVLALLTELYALRSGRALATDLARFTWAHPPLRYSVMAWGLVTGCHIARWPGSFTKFDPYSALGAKLIVHGREAAQQARRDLER